ncbi:unnamed protein product [Rotaria magnacalcarata]
MIINLLTFICVTTAHQLSLADTNVLSSNRLLDAFSRSFILETIATDSSDSYIISHADNNEFLSNVKKPTLDNLLMRNERSTSLSDPDVDEQLVLENKIEEEWNYLLTSGPLTINHLNNLLVYGTDLNDVANESVIYTRTIIDRLQNSHDLISEVMQISAYTHSAQAVGSGKKRSYAFEPTYNNQDQRTKEFDENNQLDTKNKPNEYRTSSDVKSFQIANAILNGFTTVVETIKDNNLLKTEHIENERDIEKLDIKTNQQRATRSIIGGGGGGGGSVSRPNKQEIQDIITNSNVQINQIMVQWSRLMIFFHKLVAQIEPVQKSILKDYIGPINDLQDGIFHLDSVEKEFFLSMLVNACLNIDEQADLLYAMSKAYTDISSEYIINQTNNMNLLILQSNDEKASYLREISNQITLIITRVIQLAEDQKNHHFVRINNRRKEYQQILVDFTGRKKTAD